MIERFDSARGPRVHEDSTLRAAAERLAATNATRLVVVDDAGRVVGTLSDRDLCTRAVAFGRDPDRSSVAAVMAPGCAEPDPEPDAHAVLRYVLRRVRELSGDASALLPPGVRTGARRAHRGGGGSSPSGVQAPGPTAPPIGSTPTPRALHGAPDPHPVPDMFVQDFMTPDPVTADPGLTAEEALLLMDHNGVRHLPVVEEDRLVGVVSDRDLLGSTGWRLDVSGPSRMRLADVMNDDPITVNPDDRAIAAAVEVSSQGVGCLPVIEGGRLVGIVSEMDLIRLVAGEGDVGFGTLGPVRSIAALPAITATPEADFSLLDELMAAKGIRHLPIVQGGTLVGMVSDRDLRRTLGDGGVVTATAADLMSPGVVTVAADADIRDVAAIMWDRRVSALGVLDGDRIGIVTSTDLVEFALGTLETSV